MLQSQPELKLQINEFINRQTEVTQFVLIICS